VDAEEESPELRHLAPDGAPGHDIDALHDGDQHGETERQRHEQEVIEGRERELQPRQLDQTAIDHGRTSSDVVSGELDWGSELDPAEAGPITVSRTASA